MASDTEAHYRLSTELLGHSGDVRAVCTFSFNETDYIVTASRDKTAMVWTRDDNKDFVLHKTLTHHTGYVSSLVSFVDEDEVLLVTGSQDCSILMHSIQDPLQQEPILKYSGHKGLISSLIYQNSFLISASWDSTVRIWNTGSNNDCIASVKGHEPAVWCLSGLYNFDCTNRFLSGGADKLIRLWSIDSSSSSATPTSSSPSCSCVCEYRGHSDVVRDVKVLSCDQFLSASNDCSIRLWNIHTGLCLKELFGHEAFIYSITLLPTGFASCGEDGTIRIWRDDKCIQVISLPCISVWCVTACGNGDIVSGSSDSTARVFTVDVMRSASERHLSTFHTQVEEFKMSRNKQSIDVSSLPKIATALLEPGKKTGDTKLVNNNGVAEVYQWDADILQWVKIGDAVGQADSKVHKGKEYDYVFDIEIDDGGQQMRKLKLPYNKSDDPYVAAEKFLQANNIPSWYLDQVAEFIMTNADVQHKSEGYSDPFTGGARYVPGQDATQNPSSSGNRFDPFTGASAYHPSTSHASSSPAPSKGSSASTNVHYPISMYQSYSSSSDYVEKIIGKLSEFSTTNSDECFLTPDELGSIKSFCMSLFNSPSQISLDHLSLLSRLLLNWPPPFLFPVLDVIRLSFLNKGCSQFLTTTPNFMQLLHDLSCGPTAQPKNQLLVLRIICNSFTSLEEWAPSNKEQIFVIINNLLESPGLGKNQQTSLAAVVINYSCYFGKARDRNEGIVDLVQIITKVLSTAGMSDEGVYGALISLGTLLSMKSEESVSIPPIVHSILATLLDSDITKISDCSLLLLESLNH
ncbi:PREDICTED: phospholipase A-2-activating protein-like [Amphimedon queenslandica]|uniref:Phospholipase A-2-activating protein n=1 Tax=Amphimedon queenslandica TaxID=400682 RepID=A0A1X7UMU1_AMPQE|nr:PREDICTED: phospholipase A-2-activating protein-like [Amphimedon queenslandica]|eukprot:XP_019853296.1 PREDICTED: phospholipase A-2-activating protein-like [Amphimedon queenslandica]